MTGWMEVVRTVWPIGATVTPFVLAAGFAWLKNQFPTKADLENLRTEREEKVAAINAGTAKEIAAIAADQRLMSERQGVTETKLNTILVDLDREPSKVGLSKDIGKVAERVGRIEAGLDGLRGQLATHNDYLHTLINKHIP